MADKQISTHPDAQAARAAEQAHAMPPGMGGPAQGGSMPGGPAGMPASAMDPRGDVGNAMPAGGMDGGAAGLGMSGSSAMPGAASGAAGGLSGGAGGGGVSGGGGGGGGGGGASGSAGGQSGASFTPRIRTCATMDVHRRLLSEDPGYVSARNAIENMALHYQSTVAVAPEQVTRIPVVVHVVWHTEHQNISDEQIASQIAVLNRDFRRNNADIGRTPEPFKQLTADAHVEFFLATEGPDGAPTTGVTRRQTDVAAFDGDDLVKSESTGGTHAWPSERYLNIWVCPLGGGLLGYAQFPGGPAETDGVVILQSAFGTVGTAAAPFNLGRTATHEIGHWLNLNHIWGDDGSGCAGSDNVADTPNQGGANTGKPDFPHLSCNNGPHGDMFMNYMDYVDDDAMFMFSTGQVTRMRACLDGPRSALGGAAGARAASPRSSSSPVAAWGPNRIDLFALGSDCGVYHKAWDGAGWAPQDGAFEAHGGVATCAPQVVSRGPGRLDLFVTGTDSALYHKAWDGSAWQPASDGYDNLGGVCVGEPRAVARGPDRLDVFVLGTDRALYHKWWDGSRWGPSDSTFEALGGLCVSQPEVVSWGPDRLDLFLVGTDRALYHKAWDGTAWAPSTTGYVRLGGQCLSSPRAVSWGPNRIDVFVVGLDQALYRKVWDGNAWWPAGDALERLGGVCVGEPEAVAWGPNRLDVFVSGTDRALYHKAWNGGSWLPSASGFEALGGVCSSRPRAVSWGAGRLDLFVTGTDQALYHKAWTGAGWSPSPGGYDKLGGVLVTL